MTWTAWKGPSANSQIGDNGGLAWSSPDNAHTDDDNAALAGGAKNGGISQVRRFTGFGFTTSDIPDGSTINGIEVRFDARAGNVDLVLYSALHDATNGVTAYKSEAAASTSRQDYTEGGAADLWGNGSIDDADVRASTFGPQFYAENNSTSSALSWDIYYIEVRVDYTAAGGTFTATSDQTLPSLTQKATNYAGEATASQTLPSLTQAATGAFEAILSGDLVLPALTQSATASLEGILSGASTLPSLEQSASAAFGPTATIAQELPRPMSQSASGPGFEAQLAGASGLPSLRQSATAAWGQYGPIEGTLGSLTQDATAHFDAILTGASELGAIVQAALAKADFVATASGTLASLEQGVIGWHPGDPHVSDTADMQLPVDFQYAGRPQGGGDSLGLRGLSNDEAIRRLEGRRR